MSLLLLKLLKLFVFIQSYLGKSEMMETIREGEIFEKNMPVQTIPDLD